MFEHVWAAPGLHAAIWHAQRAHICPRPQPEACQSNAGVCCMCFLSLLVGAAAAMSVRDPHEPGSYGICPSLLIFGVYCPGCGSLRAMADAVAGDPVAAIGHNLLFLPALVGLLVWAVVQLVPRTPTPHVRITPAVLSRHRWLNVPVILLVVVIAFGVLRNLPYSPLAP